MLALLLIAALALQTAPYGDAEARVRGAEVGPALDRVLLGADAGELFALFAAHQRGDLALDAGRADAVRAALVGPRSDGLVRALWPLRDAPYAEPDRRIAVQLLGEVGGPREMPLVLELAAHGAPDPTPPLVRADFERAALRMLVRQPHGLDAVPAMIVDAPVDLLEPLIRSAGAVGGAAALEVLSASLGRRSAADMRLLAELQAVAELAPHPIDPRVCARVRRYLTATDPLQRIAAIGASAALEDVEALQDLCAALGDPMLAGFAEPALRAVTGKDFKRNLAAWEGWIAMELEWWEGPARVVLLDLAHGNALEAATALAELGPRRLPRHELALAMVPGLWRREPDLVARTCSKLASLGSRAPLGELSRLLAHHDERVREAAHDALRRITGKRYPADDERWSMYVKE